MFLDRFVFAKYKFLAKKVFFILLFLGAVFNVQSQKNSREDFNNELLSAKDDTAKVEIYYMAARFYWNRNSDSSVSMADSALKLATKINYEVGIAHANIAKGVALGSLGRYSEALSCHFQALRISERLKMPVLTGNAYNDIGIVYLALNDHTKALDYFKRSLKISLDNNEVTNGLANGLFINIGEIFKTINQPDSAIVYTLRGLDMARKAKDSLGIAIALLNIGDNYIKKKMYDKALSYVNESKAISLEISDDEGIVSCNNLLSLVYFNKGNYEASLNYAERSLQQSITLNSKEIKKTSYNLLYLNYRQLNNLEEALRYRNLEIALSDSISLAERDRVIKKIQTSYELDNKQAEIDKLEKDKEIKQKEITQAKLKRNLLIAGFVLLALIAFFLYGSYTEKKLLSQQLERQNNEILAQNQQLEELNEVKNKMFSIVSHDLRGPINGIKSMIDLIRDNLIAEQEVKTIMPKLSNSLLQTSYLLDNLLYWARSQMNGIQMNAKSFSLSQLIAQNITLLQSRAVEKKITLKVNDISKKLTVFGDEAMMDIVLRNLLENALKFSSEGGSITVAAKQDDEFVTVSVEDKGRGISKENQAKIFNKLTSITTVGTGREKGNGLGLLLCKELVERNKGKIWFTSRPGEGSAFFFTIPLSTLDETVTIGV